MADESAADEFAGTLTERVAVETWIEARDAFGADAGHWQASGALAASVIPDARGSAVVGEARRSARRWRVVLRPSAPISLLSRLIWQGRLLAVRAVESDPRRPDRLTLSCEERQA